MEEKLEDGSEISALNTEREHDMEEATEQDEDATLPTTTPCTHPGFIKDLCIKCGELVSNASGTLPFEFLAKDLTLRKEEAIRLCDIDFVDMMRQKKLHLILDLDNTLLHSIDIESLILEENYLKHNMCPTDDFSSSSLYVVETESWKKMVKLRPYVRTFLEEASKYFCLSIATYGTRKYALAMAKILDPSGSYFNTRVVSRDDLTKSMWDQKIKRPEAVLGHRNVVLILDDTKEVWRRNTRNLIWITSYDFFYEKPIIPGRIIIPLLGRGFDEDENQGALANVLKILKRVHTRFFDPTRVDKFVARDVRMELDRARVEVSVPHCFSRVIGSWKPFQLVTLLPKDKIMLRNEKRLSKICRMKIGLHIKIFVWRAICGDLPTKDLLAKHEIGDNLCAICGLNEETALHLFFYCKITKMVWFNKWNIDSSLYEFEYICEWFDAVCSPHKRNWCHEEKEEEFVIFAFTLAYKIWAIRNHLKHQGHMLPPDPSSSSFTPSLGCVLDPDDLPLLFL